MCTYGLDKRQKVIHGECRQWWENSWARRLNKESACNAGDPGSIPGSGRSPGEGNGTHFSFLAWRMLWTEEPGGLQSRGSQNGKHDWATNTFQLWCTASMSDVMHNMSWERNTSRLHILSPCLINLYVEYIMWNAGLDEAQAGIKFAGRNINFRYADDTTLMAESEEELEPLDKWKRRVKKLA